MRKSFIMLLSLPLMMSCGQEAENKKVDETSSRVVAANGLVNLISNFKPPEIILLSDMPKPQVIEIPSKVKGSFTVTENGKEKIIDLLPPIINSTGHYYIMENYTTNDGLPIDSVVSGIVDRSGNLWFGTWWGGLSRYDGKSFTNYTIEDGLVNNSVTTIFEDSGGNFWFGTEGGISYYDGKKFTNYTLENGLPSNIISSIVEEKSGNLWFGTSSGLVRYDRKSFTIVTKEQIFTDNHITSLCIDKKGNLWVGTEDGLIRYDGKTFIRFSKGQGLPDNHITSILEHKSGKLWFGTTNGISRYDGKSFTVYTDKEGLVNNNVTNIHEDKYGSLWFATLGGVSRFDGKSFVNFTKDQGLSINEIKIIVEDQTGNLWFGGVSGGISRFDGDAFTNYSVAQGFPGTLIISIIEDKKGYIWLGTMGKGLGRYDGKSLTTYTKKQGLAGETITCFLEDNDGNLWIGTDEGLSRYDGKSFTNFTTAQGLKSNKISGCLKDHLGNLWFGTEEGLTRYDGKYFTNYSTEQGLSNNRIVMILEDKMKHLWFVTEERGISLYDGASFTNFSKKEGFPNDSVFCIMQDNMGNLWFGTSSGMTRYDGKTFLTYTTSNGLPDNQVYFVIVTEQQDILAYTNQGISILTGFTPKNKSETKIDAQNNLTNNELENYNPIFEIYNTKTGYPVKDGGYGQNYMLLDSKGMLWFYTGSEKIGLIKFNYAALHKNKNPPDVVIQGVKINSESFKKFSDIQYDGIEKFYPVPLNLQLPYSKNNIAIEFAAIEPARPQDVLYQYKLDGYDTDWSHATNESKAIFGNTFEGSYRFKVKARSPYGIWSEPITYNFKVLPPWYRTWWAYSLFAVSAVTVIYLIFLWRTAALRKRQRELEQTVKERTAEVVEEKKKSDELLLNILPAEVAEELKQKGSAKTKSYEQVTVIFTDFKNFTKIAEKLSADDLVAEIDYCFKGFDKIISKYPIEKIKTIGDSYMAAGGLPIPNKTNAKDVVSAAMEILQFMEDHKKKRKDEGKEVFDIRIGINTGPVVAGVVGTKKFAYDIWGDAVNLASRMESSDEPGRVNISESTYSLVKNQFICEYRGKVLAKGKGEVDMYFVNKEL
jgi:ligand-binding sensor domain-containing protein/class 3 adenylate cyclase